MGDIELLVTCPSTMTSLPSKDGGQVAQYPQAPVLPQMPVTPTTQSPLPTTAGPWPQKLQLPSGLADAEGNPFYKFSYMPPLFHQSPQYPGQYSADDISALLAQLYIMQQLPQYSYQSPGLPQFQMVPGHFQPTAPTPSPATTTIATTFKHDGIPHRPQQLHQFPIFHHQYPFMPLPSEGQVQSSQMLKPHYPQMFQIPGLSNPKYLPQQNTQTVAATTSTSAPPTTNHAPQKPLFNPYLYMPHYVPHQAFVPKYPVKPEQHGQQPVYHAAPQFYPFGYQQIPKLIAGDG